MSHKALKTPHSKVLSRQRHRKRVPTHSLLEVPTGRADPLSLAGSVSLLGAGDKAILQKTQFLRPANLCQDLFRTTPQSPNPRTSQPRTHTLRTLKTHVVSFSFFKHGYVFLSRTWLSFWFSIKTDQQGYAQNSIAHRTQNLLTGPRTF